MNSKSRDIAFIGVMAALMFVILMLETYVFIYFIKPSPAFLSIPLAISLSIFRKKKSMFIGGTTFGFCSFILSFIVGYPTFYNPLISILPRVIFGVLSGLTYILFSKLFSKSEKPFINSTLPMSIAGAFGVIFNTVFTLLAMSLFAEGDFLAMTFQTILGFNFVFELISAIILVPIITNVALKFTK